MTTLEATIEELRKDKKIDLKKTQNYVRKILTVACKT